MSRRASEDYIPNYYFEVQIGLMIKVNFSKISNISASREYEVCGDGGNNDRPFFFEKPKRQPDVLTFSKGMLKNVSSAVLAWLVEGLKVNDIMILVRKEGSSKPDKILFVEQGYISKVSYTDLDAANDSIFIKTMEIQHTGIVEIPI